MLRTDRTNSRRRKRRATSRKPTRPQPTVEIADYRHKAEKRKNNPDAGLASYNYKPQTRVKYGYDPHLDPQLIWAGKAERASFDLETISLHIHERISTKAILKSVQRAQQQRQEKLFAEPDLPLDKRIEFYQYEMDWANRLILGDSLLVMNSLLERELIAGKVQMIYLDPPYGIAYNSNFQPSIGKRDVKDTDGDLTREPEQIQAYRDTWQLGVHSYLTYLRDRLLLCRKLLHDSGSIFVQINDENLPLVSCLLDEIFGRSNLVGVISFAKTGGMGGKLLGVVNDFLLWYAKDREQVKYRQLYLRKELGGRAGEAYTYVEVNNDRRRLTKEELEKLSLLPADAKVFRIDNLTSQGFSANTTVDFHFQGRRFHPGSNSHWKTTVEGLQRLVHSDRVFATLSQIYYVRYLDDFGVVPVTTIWGDTSIAGYGDPKLFAVQTNTKVVERCILMTTDPGDLVFDPTCGSGTTAYCAEKWGRRWITCDTSRVALSIARQRLMTAKFDYHELTDPERGPPSGLTYESIPHIMLENIAKNAEIDEIADRYQPQIDEALAELNRALNKEWKEWQVPRDENAKWPDMTKEVYRRLWTLKKKKRHEIDGSISRNAKPQLLYDQPRTKHDVVRVSGPFTVEAIPVPIVEETPGASAQTSLSIDAVTDHINVMINLLQKNGVTFAGGKRMTLENLRPISSAGFVHAEGEVSQNGVKVRIAVSFGPRYGPVTARQVDEAIRTSYRFGFDALILAGFAFDPEAQATIQKNPIPRLKIHLSHISPDVIVGDLLKATKGSQLFTVFGQPDVRVEKGADGFVVKLLGVDIYDPETGEVHSTSSGEIPAWFLDEDYDGYTFRICQAFFPKEATAKNPWDRLENALRGVVDKDKMEMFRGTESLAFRGGQEKRIAVKVIDNRGNEVMVVKSLGNGKE